MNKTVTINISGIIFHIEEEAYSKLSQYLNTIKTYFNKADGGSEIMSDIEARIAEMLQGKTSATKQVVLMADVDFVMESMGKPEEFAEETHTNESENKHSTNSETHYSEPIQRRLYRDGDNKMLGGVCSGVGHYFDFDPVWLRIALLLLLVFAGTGVLIYAILWIAIPEAKTLSEKLAMKGEKADINNISKAVKEEAEQLKKRMEKYGNDFRNMASSKRDMPRNAVEKFVDFVGDLMLGIGRVLFKIIGIFMIIFGIIFFFVLSGSAFGISFMSGDVAGKEWIDMLFLDGRDFYLGFIGIIIFVGTPVIMMIYAGIRILFKIHYSNRWINFAAGIIWLVGFSMLLYVGIRTFNDFKTEAKVRQNIHVTAYDIVYLKMNERPLGDNEFTLSFSEHHNWGDDEDEYEEKERFTGYAMGRSNDSKYLLGPAKLNILKSQSDKLELVIVKEANGSNKKTASERAKDISYEVVQIDSLLIFDNLFKIINATKFRDQRVTAILKLPVGQIIYIDRSLKHLLNDIENTSNTYDGEMINRRWKMTKNGLKCIDCRGLYSDHEEEEESEATNEEVNIDLDGTQIKTDSAKTEINSKQTKLVIDKKGIHFSRKK